MAASTNSSGEASRSRTNSEDANLTNFFGLEKVLPPVMDPSSLVKMGSDNSNVGTGAIQRDEAINTTLAALVAQVLPNGNLVIDGHQQVRVNNELRDMRLSGIVRREMTLDQAGDALIDMIRRTATGRLTAAEALGHREFVMTKLYRSA